MRRLTLSVAVVAALWAGNTQALDQLTFAVPGAPEGLEATLRGTSLLLNAQTEGRVGAQDLFAAAQSDYARLLGALYAAGHYAPEISIKMDGREVAGIAPLNAPRDIRQIEVTVKPGPVYTFARAVIAPLAPKTTLPEGFAAGRTAFSGTIRDAADTAVTAWRGAGHAKAGIGGQALTADHRLVTIDAGLTVAPGPLVRLGALEFTGQTRMHEERLRTIAGFPEGTVYSPRNVARVAERLRRTGVFRSVTLTEADRLGPGDTLDVTATLLEEAPRRFGFGAEIASLDGLTVNGYWLHRNLWGGAERLRVEGEVSGIGGQGVASGGAGAGYRFNVAFERPATFTPDTTFGLNLKLAYLEEVDQTNSIAEAGFLFTHFFSDTLTARAGLLYRLTEVDDTLGRTTFRKLVAPIGVTWDRRDNKFDARSGTYLDAQFAPFLGFGTTNSGARITADARAYRAFGDRIVLAGRVQAGAVLANGIAGTSREDLFYSGGGGTVRGQPFQALGVNVLPGQRTGGMRFLAGSVEVRGKVTDTIGAVAFFDVGHVGANEFFDAQGGVHAGAGLGLRYATPIGPIRLDVAVPAAGNTGRGVQFYIGIGQAF